ncbi:MAG: SBBP repeat-containing protein [Thermodesulfobacteriota bacterium]
MNSRKKLEWTFFTSFMVMALFATAIEVPIVHADVTEEWVASYDGAIAYTKHAIATDSAGNVYVAGYSSYVPGIGNSYVTVAHDSAGNQLWMASYKGPMNGGTPTAIAIDSAGNVYVTGGNLGLGTSADYATVSYDSSGNQRWVARYNGPFNSQDIPYAIATDSAGNVYVTGFSESYNTTWGRDYATVAYDSFGNQLWVARYNGVGGDYAQNMAVGIATDNAGNVYVTGFSPGLNGMNDYATVAYDSSGNQRWVARYNGPGNAHDIPCAIVTDNANNVYVTGYSAGLGTEYDSVTIAYDSSGKQLWVNRYNGPDNSVDISLAMAIDSADNVYVTGYSSNKTYTETEYVTIAYDSYGNQLWLSQYSGSYNSINMPIAIATDSAGNVYVNGNSGDSQYGSFDSTTVAYDSFGSQLWVASYKGPENSTNNMAMTMTADSAGNVYVAGNSYLPEKSSYVFNIIKYSQGIPNQPPLAEAGVDQTVECAGAFGSTFTLDGSGSTDPDGDALTYTWSGPFGTKIGKVTTVTLPLGTHTITLTIDDGKGGTATDNVEITVEDTTPPVVTVATLSGNELLPGLYLSDVLFEMEATDTCSGVAEVSYALDTTQTNVSGSYASATISSGGDHSITYEALDNGGNVSEGGSLAFSLFEANASGISGLIDHFLAQGLIDSQMATSLNIQATTGVYGAFINHVEAQNGKKIDPVAAQVLIEATQSIMGN